jgi:hypothetical protein
MRFRHIRAKLMLHAQSSCTEVLPGLLPQSAAPLPTTPQVGLQALELVDLEVRRSQVRCAEDPSAAPAAVAQRALEASSGRGPPLGDK